MNIVKRATMSKKVLFALLLFSGMLSACSSNVDESVPSMGELEIQITMSGWSGVDTRAAGEARYPISILLAKDEEVDLRCAATVVAGNRFSITVPPGRYELYAVCGLPSGSIPSELSDPVAFKNSETGEYEDFSLDTATVDITTASSSANEVEIVAKPQMALLDVNITNVPSTITSLKLFVKGQADTYCLDRNIGWKLYGESKYIEVPLTQNATTSTTYAGSIIMPPCANDTKKLEYLAVATSSNGQKSYLTCKSSVAMPAGTHLTQSIDFTQMAAEGEIAFDDWAPATSDGSFSEYFQFTVGQQYVNYPATVYFCNNTTLCLFAHKPMTVKLSEMKAWSDKNNINYTLLPEIDVSAWALPTNSSVSGNFIKMVNTIGIDKLNEQLESTGNEPIDKNAKNVIAMYDPAGDRFYCYDFSSNPVDYILVNGQPTEDFLLYPTGIIRLNPQIK